jgi:hypothetical protein
LFRGSRRLAAVTGRGRPAPWLVVFLHLIAESARVGCALSTGSWRPPGRTGSRLLPRQALAARRRARDVAPIGSASAASWIISGAPSLRTGRCWMSSCRAGEMPRRQDGSSTNC